MRMRARQRSIVALVRITGRLRCCRFRTFSSSVLLETLATYRYQARYICTCLCLNMSRHVPNDGSGARGRGYERALVNGSYVNRGLFKLKCR